MLNLATIDLGSSSFHLTITQVDANKNTKILTSSKQKIQLRSGILPSGQLSEAVQQKALACLSHFAIIMAQYHVAKARVIGTYTLRAAKDIAIFLEKAKATLGTPIHVITGEEEARLIFVGASLTHGKGLRRLVIDIGGGSTEIIIGKRQQLQHAVSLPLGCVSFQEKFFKDGLMTTAHFANALAEAHHILAPEKQRFLDLGWDACIGISGTLQVINSILREAGWVSRQIDRAGLLFIKEKLLTIKHVQAIQLPGLREDRANILPGGLCVLLALFESLNIQSLTLSKGGIREGMLYELIEQTFSTQK